MPETGKGGFEYEIRVLTDLEALRAFRDEVKDTRDSLSALAKDMKTLSSASSSTAASKKELAAASRIEAKSAKDLVAADEIRIAALAKLEAAAKRILVAEEAANIEKKNNFNISKQAASQTLNEQKVLQKLVATYNKQNQGLIALAQAKEFAANQTTQFTAAELRAAGVLDQSTLQIAAARDKLNKTRATSQQDVINIQAEAQALDQVNKELITQAALRAKTALLRGTPTQGVDRTPTLQRLDPAEQSRRETELAALREDIQKRAAATYTAFEKETTDAVIREARAREEAFRASEERRVSDLRTAIQQRAALRAQFEAEEVGRAGERARQAFEAEQQFNRQAQQAIRQRLEEESRLRDQFNAEEIGREAERVRSAQAAEEEARRRELVGIRERLQREESLKDAFNREEIQRAGDRARAAQQAEEEARRGEQELIRKRLQEEAALRDQFAREELQRKARLASEEAQIVAAQQSRTLEALKQNIIERTGVSLSSEKELESLRNKTANKQQQRQNALIEVQRRRLALEQRRISQQIIQNSGVEKAERRQDRFNKVLSNTERIAGRVLFTFRRLVGILAVFTLARKAAQAFTNSIRTAVQFNSKLEQSRIAIASLVVAAGVVTDAFGNTAQGGEALALGIEKAREQQTKLRQDALFTAATYEELVDAYQTAIAPGLQVGFDLDQIRRFSVQISQAATAIGLPQKQLAEEIRSLLQGTIRARDTRIAVSLGITNADIKRAKELGQLAEFLDERFASFNEAAEEAQGTFALLASNTRDALVQLAGFAGAGFFEVLKGILSDIRDSVTDISEETGAIELDPKALSAMESFFDILEAGADQFKILLSSFSAKGLQSAGENLKDIFTLGFASLRIFIQGVLDGLGDILTVVSAIDRAFLGFFNILRNTFGDAFVGGIQELLAGLVSVTISVGALNFALTTLLKVSVFGILARSGEVLLQSLRLLIVAAFQLVSVFRSLKGAVAVIALPFIKITAVIAALAAAFLIAKNAKEAFLDKTLEEQLVADYKKIQEELRNTADELQRGGNLEGLFNNEELDKGRAALAELKESLDELGIDPDTFVPPTLAEKLAKTKEGIVSDLETMFNKVKDFGQGLLDAGDNSDDISKSFDVSVSAITSANRALEEQLQTIRDIEDSNKQSDIQLKAIVSTLNASIEVQQLRANTAQAEFDAIQANKEIITAITQEEQAILAAQKSRIRNDTVLAGLSDEQAAAIAKARRNILGINDARKLSSKLETEIALTQQEIAALGAGHSEERISAIKRLSDLTDKLKAQNERISSREIKTQEIINRLKEDGTLSAEAINALTLEHQEALAEIIAREKNIADLKKQQADVTSAFLGKAAKENLKIALQETFETVRQTRELKIQADTQQKLATLKRQGFVDPNKEAVILAQEEIQLQQLKKQELREQNAATQAALDLSISENRFNTTGLALIGLKGAAQARYTEELRRQNAELDQTKRKLEELKLIDERPFFAGSLEAIRQFIATSGDEFTQSFNFIQTAFQGFANTVGASIASIFDPTNTQSAKERWGRFLLQLVQQAISALISIALAQKILVPWLDAIGKARAGSKAAFAVTRATFGFKEGGEIPDKAQASPAHFINPKGLALGGGVAVAGPPNRVDTVPIWAQSGEFMMRLSAVKKYGVGVMQAINQGLIDASTLRGLGSSRSFSRRQAGIPKRGYQTGGEIQSGLARLSSEQDSGSGQQSGPQMGFLLASENQMEMMLRGGKNAMMRFLSENSTSLSKMFRNR